MHRLLICIGALCLTACSYLAENLSPNPQILQTEDPDWIVLKPVSRGLRQTGIIYIPGGFVDPHAYISAVEDLVAIEGHVVLIPKVAANLAILNIKKALDGPEIANEVQDWLVGGHSLGGTAACILVEQSPETFAGLFLTGSYSSVDLSNWDRPVLSLLGEFDGVLQQTVLDESMVNLPPAHWLDNVSAMPTSPTIGQTIYHEIAGGNHAGFGEYGPQRGDDEASIGVDEQHQIVNEFIKTFLRANNLDQ
ncbi:MAG: alpha/beta hydrolase [Bacteroidota bacterium]